MFVDHVLYLDNFRGFSDSYIPIKDVSFLVGENSTGKSSALSLLKLLGDERLLLLNQFTTEDVDLGTFRDIVSAHADDSSYFRIGILRRKAQGRKNLPYGFLVTYEQHAGLPLDVSFSCNVDSKEIFVRRVEGKAHYRMRDFAFDESTDMRRVMDRWVEEQANPTGEFKVIDWPLGASHSLLFPLSILVHPRGEALGKALPLVVEPSVFPHLTWIAPIRTKARRTYDALRHSFSSEGAHTPYALRRLLDNEKQAEAVKKTMHRVGAESGLFDSVVIKKYGEDITAPFEVQIVLHEKAFGLTNVGYGVSQALPVLTEMLWGPSRSWLAVQQPEVHLHPRAQAAFGDLIFASAKIQKKKCLIETHSDFLIDRFRSRVRKSKGNKPDSQILFFERKRGRNVVTPLPIDDKGELPSKQPQSYRAFFIKEAIETLGI